MKNVSRIKVSSTVEISSMTVAESFIVGASGRRAVPEDIGKVKFFVDVIEPDGCRIGMWSGEDYGQARAEAIECGKDFDGRIVDLTGRAA